MGGLKIVANGFIEISVLFYAVAAYLLFGINYSIITNQDKVESNSFVGEYEISNVELTKLKSTISRINDDFDSSSITLIINDVEHKFSINKLGIKINSEELIEDINNYQDSLDYWTLYNNYSSHTFDKVVYDYSYEINEEKLRNFLTKLKSLYDVKPQAGRLSMGDDRVLRYVDEVVGYELDIDKSIEVIKDNFKNMKYGDVIELVGEKIYTTDKMKNINTKISSYTTFFDTSVSRKYNLIAGTKYIDGVIINPNEVFSFYDHAGPFNKEGYVGYQGILGNGVCQVASTLYNAELLAGLTTVERYNHGWKSVYVPGGFDATVAQGKGYLTDFKFKNTLSDPVYISAYVSGNKVIVEFWSTETAQGGKTYKTESVKLGFGTYRALLHVYQGDKKIETRDLGISYYSGE